MCMSALPACLCAPCECLVSHKSEEGTGSGPGVVSGCKPRGCLEPTLGPLQKPQVLSERLRQMSAAGFLSI